MHKKRSWIDTEYKAKITLIGEELTGKTSLILRFIKNQFTNQYLATLGADFVDYQCTHSDLSILDPSDVLGLVIWDLGGQAHFRDIIEIYCRGSAGVFIVFDVSMYSSFKAIPEWIRFVKKTSPHAKIMIVGNKADLPSVIPSKEIQALQEQIGKIIYFSSAKRELNEEGSNVKSIFQTMGTMIVDGLYNNPSVRIN